MGDLADAGKEIDAIKQKTDALGKEILQMENQGAGLIKKEIALEDRLVAVLGQMLELEKGKIADAKRSGAAKEAALMGRITALQNKQREFEKRKEMLRHLKDKSAAIKEEMGNAERKMQEEIAELYRIKEIKKKHAVEKAAQKAAKAAAKKAVKKPKAALKLKKAVHAKKPTGKAKKAKAVKKVLLKKAVKRAKQKKAAAKKPAAVKKAVVKKPVKIKKPKARAPKLKLAKKPAFLEELPEEEEEAEEEAVEEEEAEAAEEVPAEEEAQVEEEAAPEEAAEEEAVQEEEEQPAEEAPAEDEAPAEEAAPEEEEAEEEPSALLERVLRKAKKEKVAEEEPAAGEEAGAKEPADYDFTEFSSVDVSISHPDWPEKSDAPQNALLSRGTGNFSFDLLQIPAQGRSVDDVVAQAAIKIESNIGSRVLEKKKTGDKAFIVYSESRNGREFLNKAIFVLHIDKIFKLVFSAPTEQFDKINEIFWKAAKSISFK